MILTPSRRFAFATLLLFTVAFTGPLAIGYAMQDPAPQPLPLAEPPAVVQPGAPAMAPAAVPAAAGTVVAPGQTNEWGVSLIWAYLSTVFLQQWKRSGIRGMSEQQTRLMKKIVAWGVAALSAIGIHISFDVAAGELLVTGLLWSSVLGAGSEIVRQYVAQQVMYHGVVQRMDEPVVAPTT